MTDRIGTSLAAVAASATLAALVPAGCAHAQAWPARPVRAIVPGPPGGGTDILTRAVVQKMAENLGQPFVVENRAGASGIIGVELAMRAPPDGHTVLMGHSGTHAINLSLRKSLSYHPVRDFTALMLVASVPNALVVHPSFPARSARDMLAIARAKPGQVTYASAGTGFSQHLAGVLFADMGGVDMLHVPYKGSTPGMADVIGGNVMSMFPNVTTAMPHLRSGRLRALGVTSAKRSDVLPEVPAIAETLPGYEALAWFGLFGPAAMPAELVRQVNAEMVRALADPKVRDLVRSQGGDPGGGTPEQFQAFVKAEIDKWAKVIRRAGVEQE
jgi:tripartite-type tricarboxylate transporter receptor subunit TctC